MYEQDEQKNILHYIKAVGFLGWSIVVVIIFFISIFAWSYLFAEKKENTASAESTQLRIYEFWGEGCPHCAAAKPFLKGIETDYENVELHQFEVYYNVENQKKQKEVAQALGKDDSIGVPYTIIGDEVFNGFDNAQGVGTEMIERVEYCLENECSDKTGEILGFAPLGTTTITENNNTLATDSYKTISINESKQLIQDNQSNDQFVILDVRTPAEFNENKINPTAINRDVESDDFENSLDDLDPSKTYLVYCRTGRRSAVAAELMSKKGFNIIYNMEGGTVEWYNSSAL